MTRKYIRGEQLQEVFVEQSSNLLRHRVIILDILCMMHNLYSTTDFMLPKRLLQFVTQAGQTLKVYSTESFLKLTCQ